MGWTTEELGFDSRKKQEIFLCKIWSFHGCRLQPPAHASSSLADFSTLKMEAICFSETSVHTRSTRRHIPEDGIRQEIFLFSTTIRKALGLSSWYRGLLLWGWSGWGLKMTIRLSLRVPILIMHIDKPSFLHTYLWCLCTEISLSCIWKQNLSQSYSTLWTKHRTGFQEERQGRSLRGLHRPETESADLIEIFASLTSQKFSSYYWL
jgi:hypothetical protein